MDFPNTLSPDLNTRAGRMLAAGRVKVTVTSRDTNEHITVLFKAFADNRDKQFKANGKRWEPCVLDEATHVFVEVPNQGEWNDKVGTFYPRNGRWYDADNADPARTWAAKAAAWWLTNEQYSASGTATFQEQDECARCGLELTDPVSIARGIGPICLGKMTGSQHQVKVKEQVEADEQIGLIPTPESEEEWLASEDEGAEEVPLTSTRHQILTNVVDLAMLEGYSDAEIESIIANLSRVLEKREFARREREQENVAYQAKMERDQSFLGR